MKDPQNVTIALLLISAAVITALLVTVHLSNTPQAAAQTTVKQGQYIMSVGTYSKSYDFVYVVDLKTGRMNAYLADRHPKRVRRVDDVDIGLAFRRLRELRP